MNRRVLAFETHRTGYEIAQVVDGAITVRELKEFLDNYPDDMLVIFKNDNGYTYGNFELENYYSGTMTYTEKYDEEWDETKFVADNY